MPFGASYFKSGGKWVAKQFGVRWLDDLVTIGRRADDVLTGPGIKSADDLITVRHYTSTSRKELIESLGFIRKGSYVTSPQQIMRGTGPIGIDDILALGDPRKAEWFIDLKVPRSALSIDPIQGQYAKPFMGRSGGGIQWVLTADVPIGKATFLPWYAW